jgi:hypothetical protein
LSLVGLERPTEANTLLYEAASVQGAAEGGFSQDVPIDTVIAEQEDSIFEVQMLVSASAASMGSANSVVDPIFTVPAGYRLKFSPGVGTGVPEPSTWLMMLLGFAGLGFAGHRTHAVVAMPRPKALRVLTSEAVEAVSPQSLLRGG